MPWERVDRATNIDYVEPAEVLNLLAGPSFVIIDCRRILRCGMLPRSVVLRRKDDKETLERAIERTFEHLMYTIPPEDERLALLLDFKGTDSGEEAADMAVVAAWLRQNFGCERILRIQGGVRALVETHRVLFSLSKESAANLPSKLAPSLYLGSTVTALDAKLLEALGVTVVLSVLRRKLTLEHIAAGKHLVVRPGAEADVRTLLNEALPYILSALEGAASPRVLVHGEEGSEPAASAVACAALVADGSTDINLDTAAGLIAHIRPKATLRPSTLEPLRACENFLREGAPSLPPLPPPIPPGATPGAAPVSAVGGPGAVQVVEDDDEEDLEDYAG